MPFIAQFHKISIPSAFCPPLSVGGGRTFPAAIIALWPQMDNHRHGFELAGSRYNCDKSLAITHPPC